MSRLNISSHHSPPSSMTMSKGAVVCDEIKLSALMKLAKISETRHIEAEYTEKIIKAERSATETSLVLKPKKKQEEPVKKFVESDVADSWRVQSHYFEEMRLLRVQASIDAKAAELRAHSEEIRFVIEQGAAQRERERREEEEKVESDLQEFETLEKNRTSLVLQLQAKKHQEHAKKIDRIIEEAGRSDQQKRDEHKMKRMLLEKIILKQQRFRDVFQQISDMLWVFPYREEMVASIAPAVQVIKSLSDVMDTLVKQFKVGEVSQLDLTTAESLVEKLEDGHLSIRNRLDEIKKKKQEEESTTSDTASTSDSTTTESGQTTPTPASPTVSSKTVTLGEKQVTIHVTGLEGYISPENLAELTRLQQQLESHLESLVPLDSDPKLKKFRFQCQMAVNTPLNAISAVSASHLKDKLQRLQNLLRGRPVEVGTSQVTASLHQLGIPFCMNLLAERIVVQGEQTVSSKPESAFPIAAVTLALWAEFPFFGELLLAHFYSQCPYLVPYYAPRTSGMTDHQFYSAQGYKYNSEGQIEPQDKFLKRITGTAHLFFAILTARPPRDLAFPVPRTVHLVWNWLASVLNLDPRPDVSATVVLTCLEVAGSTMSSTYHKQFSKLFLAIAKLYYPLIKQLSPSAVSGPISRLEIYIQNTVKKSSISPPAGMLSQNFW